MREARIQYTASAKLQSLIDEFGRTEDVRFSPDGRRLAIAGFKRNQILLLECEFSSLSGNRPRVGLHGHQLISSSGLIQPHGVSFADNDHLLVANREGNVVLLRLPSNPDDGEQLRLEPTLKIHGSLRHRVISPGSVDCYPLGEDRYRLLVCNNFINTVSCHELRLSNRPAGTAHRTLLRKGLQIPDGIHVSKDRQWIAVSNHVDGTVRVYRDSPMLSPYSTPDAILEGNVCPHGLRFLQDGRSILLADAGSPYVHLYQCKDEWRGTYRPENSWRMVDDETFREGRYGPQEGGVKGLDLDEQGRVLATTHGYEVVAFYDLQQLLAAPKTDVWEELRPFIQDRDALLMTRYNRMARWLLAQRSFPRRTVMRFRRRMAAKQATRNAAF